MNCSNPIRIYNHSLERYMFVPCRHCNACRIAAANKKALDLSLTLKEYPYIYFVTLTYSNDYLPIVLDGSNMLLRGCSQPFPEVIEYLDFDCNCKGLISPSESVINDCVGVLYYKDIQNFFKRLRIHYERKYKEHFSYKIFGIGEYGSKSKRPHFHVIFYGKSKDCGKLLSAIIENWQFSDWSKLDLEESFKVGDARSAFYLASYVNVCSGNDGLLSSKRFKQKVFRSKNLTFGIEKEIHAKIKKVLSIGNINDCFYQGIQQPFEFIDSKKVSNISTRLIQTRFFRTYFCKPRFCSTASFNTFRRCCGEVYLNYFIRQRKDLVVSSDYLFILGYRRYLSVVGLDNSAVVFNMFVLLFWEFYNYYKSLQLKYQMMEYCNKCEYDYFVDLHDSFIDSPSRRFISLCKYDKPKNIIDKIYHPISNSSRDYINCYTLKYKSKLLTKHIKNEINF